MKQIVILFLVVAFLVATRRERNPDPTVTYSAHQQAQIALETLDALAANPNTARSCRMAIDAATTEDTHILAAQACVSDAMMACHNRISPACEQVRALRMDLPTRR